MRGAAFTLAETLITLAIIGIVAAITIPALIEKHKKTEIETGLKKTYSTISNAIRLSEIDNGPYSEWDEINIDGYTFWNKYLQPYLKGATLCTRLQDCKGYSNVNTLKWHGVGTWNIQTNEGRLTFQLPDGTVIFWMKYTSDPNKKNFSKFIFIDSNGSRGPNKGGIDVFYFDRDVKTGKITAPKGNCETNIQFCTNELVSNGWKFPDDYPWF